MSNNVIWHNPGVTREKREKLNSHKALAVWLTGLPSSGKSTIAHAVEEKLYEIGVRTYTLDGDNIRHGLCSDLRFSPEDRAENLRRIAEVVKLFIDAGLVVLCAFVSPFEKDRKRVKQIIVEKDFMLVYCKCPVEICEKRDPKGLYKRARAGEIKEYTGISAPYEEPESPDLMLETDKLSLEEAVNLLFSAIKERIFK